MHGRELLPLATGWPPYISLVQSVRQKADLCMRYITVQEMGEHGRHARLARKGGYEGKRVRNVKISGDRASLALCHEQRSFSWIYLRYLHRLPSISRSVRFDSYLPIAD